MVWRMRDLDLNFDDISRNYGEVTRYALSACDRFSLIAKMKKPYSKEPPNFEYADAVRSLEPFVERYVPGIREWPGTITRDMHRVMIVYRICKGSRQALQTLPNVFLPLENGLPEDICFYRGQEPWLATVSHEKMAFITQATKEDVAFLEQNDIRFFE